ncbi:hypothetical protein B0T14DRAFT_113342 [Immersiella caudata]|uniref:Uncharacterized protein n=1 Tax=Immersiella caudata TaxID=314043 RepID=A0AA40C676_9PEZI|nr:hypothetical protein B0T14DRAFT_113342 [Immersiella caudata]
MKPQPGVVAMFKRLPNGFRGGVGVGHCLVPVRRLSKRAGIYHFPLGNMHRNLPEVLRWQPPRHRSVLGCIRQPSHSSSHVREAILGPMTAALKNNLKVPLMQPMTSAKPCTAPIQAAEGGTSRALVLDPQLLWSLCLFMPRLRLLRPAENRGKKVSSAAVLLGADQATSMRTCSEPLGGDRVGQISNHWAARKQGPAPEPCCRFGADTAGDRPWLLLKLASAPRPPPQTSFS